MPMEFILNFKKKLCFFLMCLRFLIKSVLKLLDRTVYVKQNPYKADTDIWKWMLAPLKEGWKYASNVWNKNIKNDLKSY
jgi:hypothetical protein